MELKGWNIFILLIIPVHLLTGSFAKHLTIEEIHFYRNKLKSMFNYAYENYATNAGNYDELKPITCQGVETWGNFSLTLIDSMDSLILFQNYSEFERVTRYIVDNVDFNQNINVSVFETNIRVVGGLLSAHLLSYKSGMELEPGWPCEGPLLRLAVKVGRKLLPAFQTKTGMPYGTVNLRYGVPLEETPVTCTAGVGTFIVEFATLSRLTGDPIFETTALNALRALHSYRSHLNLVGNHINTSDGKWTAIESSIGSGVDSYFEYLVKGALLLKMPELMDMFNVYHQAINKYMRREDWYFVVHMNNGLTTMPVFQSLESFFPGLLTLIGDIEQAQKTILNYRYVLKRYGFIPEFFDVANNNVKRNGNPLRPEFSESLFYLYKATKDPYLLTIGAEVIEAIEYSAKTECGYATIKNVIDHTIEDRMESFFLAETLKYLYLLFDDTNFIHNEGSQGFVINNKQKQCIIETGGYIFNTEAHPIDVSALDCCSTGPKDFDEIVDSLDLYSLLGLSDDEVSIYNRQQNKPKSNSNEPSIKDATSQNLDFAQKITIQPSSDVASTYDVDNIDHIDQFAPNSDSDAKIDPMSPSITPTLDETQANLQLSIDISPSIINRESSSSSSSSSNNEDDETAINFDPFAVQTDSGPWTPIVSPFAQSRSNVNEPANTRVCDTFNQSNCHTLDEIEIITAAPSEHHFTHSIPSGLNLSDFILQYEDDEPSSSSPTSPTSSQENIQQDSPHHLYQNYTDYSEPSHEILLCSPLPFLIPFSKYGQVLMRSEI